MTFAAKATSLVIMALTVVPASAQTSGGAGASGGTASGGVGATSGSSAGSSLPPPVSGGVGAAGTGGSGVGTLSSPGSALGSGSSPAGAGVELGSSGLGTGSGLGSAGAGTATTEERASQGAATINPLNVDAIARGGSAGAASSFAGGAQAPGGTLAPSVSGAGPAELFDIPRPSVAVDLQAIRAALAAGPSATPKPDGR